MKNIILLVLILSLTGCATYWENKDFERRQQYTQINHFLPEKIKQSILKDELCLGMTKDDVIVLCGNPDKINKPFEHLTYERLI